MKEKNHFKKILALMLVLVLSINQFSVVLYAQEESSLEDFTSSDESEAEANVEADDSGFSDGTDLSDAPPSEPSSDTPVSEDKKTEAHLTIIPDNEKENTYVIEASWQITGAQDTDTRLALAMDQTAYAALPDSAKADSENVCHISALDENGEEITLPMTLTSGENDSSLLRLVYTQSGDGTVQISQIITLEKCEEASTSSISAQWYNDQWTTLEKQEIQWTKSAAEELTEPEVTETPEITAEPEVTEVPEVTETPEITDAPEVTETPEVTEAPRVTETPEVTEAPQVTEIPEATEAPDVTETPEVTDAPEVTGIPEVTEAPQVTEIPEVTETPESTGEPEVTETPEADDEADITNTVVESEDECSAGVTVRMEGEATARPRRAMRAMARNAGSVDLTDYITDAKFNVTEIEKNQNVKVSINYKIYASVLQNAGTTQLTYQLPEGIIPNDEYKGTVYDDNGNDVGTYTITKNGEITISLSQEFVASGNVIDGDIHFWSHLNEGGTSGEHTYVFSQKDQLTATIKVKENQSGTGEDDKDKTDLSVEKECQNYDVNTKSVDYTITIKSQNGTAGDIKGFNDNMSVTSGISGKVTSPILQKVGADGNIITWKFDDYFVIDNNSNIKLKDNVTLPALKAGEKYQLAYHVEYSGFDKINTDGSLGNNVQIHDDKHWPSDSTNISFKHKWISKTGRYDAQTDEIIWEIEVNNFGGDLEGYQLEDLLKKNGAEISSGTFSMIEYDGNAEVARYDNLTFPFIFKQGSESGNVVNTKHRFVISYKTKADGGFYNYYTNRADLKGGDGGFSSGEIGVDVKKDNGTLDKEFVQDTTSEDGKTKIYDWKVALNVPSDGLKDGSYYEDTILLEYNEAIGIHYITSEQLNNLQLYYLEYSSEKPLDPKYYEIQIKDGNDWKAWDGTSTSNYSSFRIAFKINESQTWPESIENLVLKYSTTADVSSMADGAVWTFRNTGKFYQDGGYTEDSAEKKEVNGGYFRKTDVGGNNGNYVFDETKGVLYYCLTVNETCSLTENGTIVIKDKLPEGTSLYLGEYDISETSGGKYHGSPNINDSVVKAYWGGNYTDYEKGLWSETGNHASGKYFVHKINELISYSCNDGILTITIPEEAYYFNSNNTEKTSHKICIFYAVQINDMLGKSDSKEYTNNAEIYVNDEKKAEDSTTSTVTKSYITKMKNSDIDDVKNVNGKDEISYRVVINPTGVKMAGGNNLTITDTVDYTKHQIKGETYLKGVGLKANSLHIYRLNENGTKGSEISTALYSVKYYESGNKFEMELSVPDEMPMILEYTYVVVADEELLNHNNQKEYSFTNDIEISGEYSDGSSVTDKELVKGSSAGARTNKLVLTKVDKDNQIIYLKGAVFELQKYIGEVADTDWKNDSKWQMVKSYTTGVNGMVTLAGLEEKAIYRLVETEAPTNYKLPDSPVYYYFSLKEDGSESFPPGFETEKENVSTGSIIIENEKSNEDYTSIEIDKQWKSSAGNLIKVDKNTESKITVNLYQSIVRNAVITSETKAYKTVDITPNDDDQWYYVFNNLPKRDQNENEYFYYVREVVSNPEQWSYVVSGENQEGIVGGKIILENKRKPGVTSVSVSKQWKEGAVSQNSVPVTLYRSKQKSQETETEQKKFITCKVYCNYNNNTNQRELLKDFGSIEVLESGSELKFLLSDAKDWYNLTEVKYTIGNSALRSAQFKTIDGSGKVNHEIICPDVNDDIVLELYYKGYVWTGDLTISESISPSAGTSGMLKLPEDAEEVGTVILKADNSWSHSWTDLSDEYYYYVLEGIDGSGYLPGYHASYSYTYHDHEKTMIDAAVITNESTFKNTEMAISVVKKWQGYSPGEYSGYVVKAKLQRTLEKGQITEDVKELELNQGNHWRFECDNLDSGYTYCVQEIGVFDSAGNKVDNFETSYSSTESTNSGFLTTTGTITITNTKKTQGITLPGTGGKDGWIFYGLGISFWAISLIWLSLTFKKRNKLIKAEKEGRKGLP